MGLENPDKARDIPVIDHPPGTGEGAKFKLQASRYDSLVPVYRTTQLQPEKESFTSVILPSLTIR